MTEPDFPSWDDLPSLEPEPRLSGIGLEEMRDVSSADGNSDGSMGSADAVRGVRQDDAKSVASSDQGSAPVLAAAELGLFGNIEQLDPSAVVGWAASHEPRELLSVRLVDEAGQLIAEGSAGNFRADVRDAGFGDGWCGFTLVPGAGTLDDVHEVVLEVEVESGQAWRPIAHRTVAPRASRRPLRPLPLLSGFAEAGATDAVVTRQGLLFGRSVWLQAARDVRERVRASLQIVNGPQFGQRIPVVRVEPIGEQVGRVDLRLHLSPHYQATRPEWLTVQVYGRSGSQQPLRVNMFDHRGRIGLGDFVIKSHQWSTLHVRVPAHDCTLEPTGLTDAVIWLELTLDAGAPLDVAAPTLDPRGPADPFECLHVQDQREILDAVDWRPAAKGVPFSVVIPFYGNAAYTAACIGSVLRSSWGEPEVVVVDDGSPATSTVQRLLQQLPGNVRVLRSSSNRGYTASVNAGVAAAASDYVVILNNDTRVTPGWDAPLLAALQDPSVFACGPLSNAASYQSVPDTHADNGWAVNQFPHEITPVRLAHALREHFRDRTLPLAILNGFCYAVRRSDFQSLGGLDEQAFPAGYGEEVDLMMRARREGLKALVSPSSFVYHYKSITFREKRAHLSKQGNAVVQQRWGVDLAQAVEGMDASPEWSVARAEIQGLLAALLKGESSG